MLLKRLAKSKGLLLRAIPKFSFSQQEENAEANFGYQKVNINEKQKLVNGVFHSVASKYDVMNDVMSLGIHRCWKDYFVSDIGLIRPSKVYEENNKVTEKAARVLDVAGGTGDIAFRIIDKHRENRTYLGDPGLKITCLDINDSMLDGGRRRAQEMGYSPEEIEFVQGDAESLNLPDDTFDLYTISFGLRNVPRTDKALKEAYRVLKKGGRFMCLEFSKVTVSPLDSIYKFYNFNLLPIMGQLIASDAASYQYLAESIDKFYDQKTLVRLIEEAGFKYASYKDLSLGICAIHTGFKL